MHLAQGLSTISTKKRKAKKLTQKDIDRLTTEWRAYNKRMRQQNCHSAQFETFELYLSYLRGEHKPKTTQKEFTSYVPSKSVHRETPHIPSLGTGVGNATRKETPKYTGDLIVGIGTMHKSNAVPIMRGTKQAEEIAKMRR